MGPWLLRALCRYLTASQVAESNVFGFLLKLRTERSDLYQANLGQLYLIYINYWESNSV